LNDKFCTCVLMKIKELSEANRPRERLKEQGIRALSDAEVLALLLQNGMAGRNVIDLSQEILALYTLGELRSLSLPELIKMQGVGEAKAMQIMACFELSRRVVVTNGECLHNPKQVYSRMQWMRSLKQEHFVVLLLDTQNRVVREETLFVGTLDSSVVHPREIFKIAVQWSAYSFILVHNHPSGNVSPSEEDLRMTKDVEELGKKMGVEMKDHVVVGEGFWSWRNG